MPRPEPVLICALSGRALAQAARAAGFAPIVLDAFGDLDTRDAAERWLRVPVDRRWIFRRRPLLAAAARLAPAPIPLIWGSGFERATALLAELAAGRPIWGNLPAVVRAVKDPFAFAAALRRSGHRPSRDPRSTRPKDPDGWLCKRAGGAGGGTCTAGRPGTAARPRLVLAAARARAAGFGCSLLGRPGACLQRAMGDAPGGTAVPLRRRRGAGRPTAGRA